MDRFNESPLFSNREREPFFTHAEPCEVCGEPCSETIWIPEHKLYIGSDCGCNSPEDPVCLDWRHLVEQAHTVQEVLDAMKAHVKECRLCNPDLKRKDAGRETPERKERAA